jgi:hypothetical protein
MSVPTNESRFKVSALSQADSSFRILSLLPFLAILICGGLYAAHFFFGGGREHLILDSWAYLDITNSRPATVPFNTRILGPGVAALIAAVSALPSSAAFKLLTPVTLLASLLAIRGMIGRRGGSPEWQAAVLVAFGSSLAVTFGFTPVLVDPILLMFICLTLAALDSGRLVLALTLACLATLTKEYGVLLGLVCSFHAYRRGVLRLASLALLLPPAGLLTLLLLRQSGDGIGFGSWPTYTSHFLFEYQLSVLRLRGPAEYSKLLYMGSWCGVWPVLVIAAGSFFSRVIEKRKLIADEVGFGLVLASVPILLLGDWSRSLIVLVPFACIVATPNRLSRDRWFSLLLALGGLSTALARPFHGDSRPSHLLTLSMTIISVIASLLLAARLFRFAMLKPGTPRVGSASPEAVVQSEVAL